MDTAEMIRHQLELMPAEVQQEVLDFVEFLAARRQSEDRQWTDLSLRSALSGMEDDLWPEYQDSDFTERWG